MASDYTREKIADRELQMFADSNTPGRCSVLIELQAVPPQLVMDDRGGGLPSRRALLVDDADQAAVADGLARLEAQLDALLAERPVRLDVAEAFVAEVTPAELRQITQLADVASIHPNRRHYVG